MKWSLLTFITVVLITPTFATSSESFRKKTFTLNFSNTDIREGLKVIADKSGLTLNIDDSVKGQLNFAFKNVTMKQVMDRVSRMNNIGYEVKGKSLIVFSADSSGEGGIDEAQASEIGVIKLNYLSARDVGGKITPLLKENERYVVDEPSNSVAIIGSRSTKNRVRKFLAAFDKMPQQILIEAQIVEVNKNFSRELGVSWGDNVDGDIINKDADRNIIVNNPSSSAPNATLRFKIGSNAGDDIYAKILAAESDGDAKIISRPKIMTINNKAASINSGVTFNVKTLSSVSSGSDSSSSGSVTGGVQQINAGLELSVTPTIVGKSKVKLTISVTNNEADESTTVDGIPGINNNSASTMIIVNNGETATMAGLIKNTKSRSEGGVPWLSKIPLIGWFFKSSLKSDRDKELMIFITPKIVRM